MNALAQNGQNIGFILNLNLRGEATIHTRTVYSILDLMGDLGGISDVLMTITSFIIAPYAAHMYLLKAFEKFYSIEKPIDKLQDDKKKKRISRIASKK